MDTRLTRGARLLCMGIVLLCTVIMLGVRLYRLDIPFERDEGEYAFIGQMLLAGAAPFSEAFTMKLPGVPVWYALFMVVFGETVRAAHVAGLVVDVISAVAIGLFCRASVVDPARGPAVGVVAGALFFQLASLLCFDGFTANCEKFVIVGVATSLAVFVRGRGVAHLVVAGVLMGTAFVCKQQALPFLAALGLAAVLRSHPEPVTLLRRARDGVVVGVAMLVPYVIVVVTIALWGDFDTFWFHTVTYASEYVNINPHALRHFGNAMRRLAREPLVVFAVVGSVAVIGSSTYARGTRLLVAVFFIASIAATSVGLYFRGHYFFFTLPFLAIAAATLSTWRWWLSVPLALVAAGTIQLHAGDNWRKSDGKVSSDHYAQTTFVRAVPLAERLAAITAADERVLIVGNEPEVLFMAKRRSVTPYIYFYPLLERQKFALQQQQEVIDATAAADPRHIVVQVKTARFMRSRKLMPDWLPKLLARYDVVWPPGEPKKLDAAAMERTKEPLFLLRRRDLPPPTPTPAPLEADSGGRERYPATTP